MPTACKKSLGWYLFSKSPGIEARAASCGNVRIEHVVHDHAVGAEAPSERANGPLHPCDPAKRQAVAVAIVKQGNHLVPQCGEERLGVARILPFDRAVSRTV